MSATEPNPACCLCDPKLCAEDDTGDHCFDHRCAWCIDGCPASYSDTCCRDEVAQAARQWIESQRSRPSTDTDPDKITDKETL